MKITEYLDETERLSYIRVIEYMVKHRTVFPKRFIDDAIKKNNFPDGAICKTSQSIGESIPRDVAIELMIWSKVFGVVELMSNGRPYESFFNKLNRKCPDTEFYSFSDIRSIDELLDICLMENVKKGKIDEFVNDVKRVLSLQW